MGFVDGCEGLAVSVALVDSVSISATSDETVFSVEYRVPVSAAETAIVPTMEQATVIAASITAKACLNLNVIIFHPQSYLIIRLYMFF